MFKGKTVLITGGTGSWGNELTKQLISKNVKCIRVYSRNELLQVQMSRKFDGSIVKFIPGDVRDYKHLEYHMEGVDYVFHLAALKHIPICEEHPYEAIKTIINGTENVIKAAIKNKVEKVIDVSTDKAVQSTNLYGMCKAIGEKLFVHADKHSKNTRFVCVRGGNVMGSNGSVIPHFIKSIQERDCIEITDINMTRYFLTLHDAIKLLFVASESNYSGCIFVMKMPSCKIIDLASVLVENFKKPKTNVKWNVTGIRQGEKLDEVLISKYEAPYTYDYSKNYYLIHQNANKTSGLHDNNKIKLKEYNSAQSLMTVKEIKEMLIEGGFINV